MRAIKSSFIYILSALILIFTLWLLDTQAIDDDNVYWYWQGTISPFDQYWSTDFTLIDELDNLVSNGTLMLRSADDSFTELTQNPYYIGSFFHSGLSYQWFAHGDDCMILVYNSVVLAQAPYDARWIACTDLVDLYSAMTEYRKAESTPDI